jgi:D-alanine-D-alanine ligase
MARAGWRGMTVGILYNAHLHLARGLARDALSEADTLNTVRAARKVVRGVGARVLDLGLGLDPRPILARLLRRPPDVVLNLCDAPRGDSSLEPTLPAFLELLGIPYTGSPPGALELCRDKPAVKARLRAAGIATPEFVVVPPGRRPPPWAVWPAIVKPASEDASCGIDRHSVVSSPRTLRARVAFLHRRYRQPALVERFVAGRELNVALVGGAEPRVLPLGEIDFSCMSPSRRSGWRAEPRTAARAPLPHGRCRGAKRRSCTGRPSPRGTSPAAATTPASMSGSIRAAAHSCWK